MIRKALERIRQRLPAGRCRNPEVCGRFDAPASGSVPDSFVARGTVALTALALLAGLNAPAGAVGPAAASVRAETSAEEQHSLELLMASQRMDKREMLRDALALSQTQSDRFWPIYYEYQAQLIPIYDRKFALIEEYADAYPNLTEQQADHLVRASLAAKRAQVDLLEKYYRRVASALTKNIAARFVQLESAWNGAFDVKLQAKLPLIPDRPAPAVK